MVPRTHIEQSHPSCTRSLDYPAAIASRLIVDMPVMTESESANGLICFTNCLLPQEDGSLIEKDLWIDERRGVILDAQVLPQILLHL